MIVGSILFLSYLAIHAFASGEDFRQHLSNQTRVFSSSNYNSSQYHVPTMNAVDEKVELLLTEIYSIIFGIPSPDSALYSEDKIMTNIFSLIIKLSDLADLNQMCSVRVKEDIEVCMAAARETVVRWQSLGDSSEIRGLPDLRETRSEKIVSSTSCTTTTTTTIASTTTAPESATIIQRTGPKDESGNHTIQLNSSTSSNDTANPEFNQHVTESEFQDVDWEEYDLFDENDH